MISPSCALAMYTFFVLNFSTLIFIAAIYGFAFKFLGDRFYISLAIGWLINACYIGLETVSMVIHIDERSNLAFALGTGALGLLSMPFFHFAVLESSPSRRRDRGWYRSLLVGIFLIAICIVGAFLSYGSTLPVPPKLIFAAFSLPAVLYTMWVLFAVALRFHELFPEEDYGLSSRLLYGSWVGYAIIQAFYPFKLFTGFQNILIVLFIIAFLLKVLGSFSLLNVLKESYAIAQEEVRETSVLADIGNVAAGLHHDIANPLSWIDSELTLLAQKKQADSVVLHAVDTIRQPVSLIDSAIKFVEFIRGDTEAIARNFKRLSTRQPVSFSVGLFKKRHPKAKMRIIQPPDSAHMYYIRAHHDLLADAFVNLLNNAFEASAGVVRINVRRIWDEHPKIEFAFRNNGKPLSSEELMNCFKPGWSSKDKSGNHSNTGMGLYMCSKIVNIHRGTLQIENLEDLNGVVAKIVLPAARQLTPRRDSYSEEQDD